MPNSYFQFKQFRIEQGQTAMKVTTEACIFGALVAKMKLEPDRILDIGAGTGLLSLMLAQSYDCSIDAVEIDANAAQQAAKNFSQSPWTDRLNVIYDDVVEYARTADRKYDLIISNPPFFAQHAKSGNLQKDTAIHEHTLTQKTLSRVTRALLPPNGYLAVLYPVYEAALFTKVAQDQGFNLRNEVILKDRAGKDPIRKVLLFQLETLMKASQSNLILKCNDGHYTNEMGELLRDYYLNL